MKGHKKACKCVGCSPATRARGMARLKNSRGRNKGTPAYASSKAHAKTMKKLSRRAAISARVHKGRMLNMKKRVARKVVKKWAKGFGGYKKKTFGKAARTSYKRMARGLAKLKSYPNKKKGPYRVYRDKSLIDRALAAFQKGRRKNPKRVPRRRHCNPDANFIGSAPSLTIRGLGSLQYPRGVLYATSDPNSIRLALGGSAAPRPGSKVTRLDYDDPVKAVEAYKEIGRFKHICGDPFIVGQAQNGNVLLISKSTAWRKE